MTITESETSSSDEQALPKKRGRKPSGKTAAEIQANASRSARERMLARGLVEMKTYVAPETKEKLDKLKIELGKLTLGEVIDEITKLYDHI